MKLQKLVERIISEEFGNKPVICNLDLNKLVDNYDDSLFGEFQEHIDNKGFDIKISKSLCLDNQVIGGCLLKKYSILSEIKNIIWHSKNTDGFNNLKFFVNKDFLDKISNKR